MSAAPPDLAGLQKASRFAGVLTLAGAVIVLGSIGYSVWRLADTEKRAADTEKRAAHLAEEEKSLKEKVDRLRREKEAIEAEKLAIEKEVKNLAATIPPKKDPLRNKPPPLQRIEDAVAERAELEQQVAVLRKEANLIRDQLKQQFANQKKDLELWAKPEYRGVMIAVLVRPTSTYRVRNDSESPTGKWYDFTLSLSFPDNTNLAAAMKKSIKAVTYEMNHPYRKVAPLVGKEPRNDFEVRYSGAGTLRNVVVKIDVADIGIVAIDYDMTKAHPEAKDK